MLQPSRSFQTKCMHPIDPACMALPTQDWIRSHKKAGIQPVISNPSRQAMHLLTKAGIPELIGEQFITVRVNDAVLMCQVRAPQSKSQSRPRMQDVTPAGQAFASRQFQRFLA